MDIKDLKDLKNLLDRHQQQMPPDICDAHKHCKNHRQAVETSQICGCFYCCSLFPPSTIEEWCDENQAGIGQTAICPMCGVDSVIGSVSHYLITLEFLKTMREHWF